MRILAGDSSAWAFCLLWVRATRRHRILPPDGTNRSFNAFDFPAANFKTLEATSLQVLRGGRPRRRRIVYGKGGIVSRFDHLMGILEK